MTFFYSYIPVSLLTMSVMILMTVWLVMISQMDSPWSSSARLDRTRNACPLAPNVWARPLKRPFWFLSKRKWPRTIWYQASTIQENRLAWVSDDGLLCSRNYITTCRHTYKHTQTVIQLKKLNYHFLWTVFTTHYKHNAIKHS